MICQQHCGGDHRMLEIRDGEDQGDLARDVSLKMGFYGFANGIYWDNTGICPKLPINPKATINSYV